MSGRLVSAVLESALPAWLKPYAVAFASFAADDGSKVFPTARRVARLVGRQERQTRTAIAALRRLQVLRVVAPGGRNTATRYHFVAERLPIGGDGEQIDLFSNVSPFPQRKASNSRSNTGFPQFAQPLTCSGPQGIPAADYTRSVSRSVKYPTYTRARANQKKQAI